MILSKTTVWFYVSYVSIGLTILLLVFNVAHDAAHHAIFRNKKWNDHLFTLTFNLLGNNSYIWKKYHIESHHLYTNVHGSDIDVLDNPLIRMTHVQKRLYIHRFQHVYAPFIYLFYSLNWLLVRDTMLAFGKTDRSIAIKLNKEQTVTLIRNKILYIAYMIVLPVIVSPVGWQHVLLAFVLMHFLMSIVITAVLAVSHLSDETEHPLPDESGKMDHSWVLLQMKTSMDYNVDSHFLNWTLGGFNAHTLHHLFPNVCHVHYPEMIPILRQTAEEFGIHYNEAPYPKAVALHFQFLKRMGHEL
jgi:linoleoyl-CoA desaturase